jgi:di/tricarboxylate transporter
MRAATHIATALAVVAAGIVYFLPPPEGATAGTMHASALVLLTIALWALGVIAEQLTALIFFLVAMVLAIAPAEVVFSGFTSATMWLVLGGLFIAHAVTVTGLGSRFASLLFDRYAGSYRALIVAVAVAATILPFLMPATVARMLLLLPIVIAAAERAGFARGSAGYYGLVLTTIVFTYNSGTGVLPANAPNMVLAGAAEALHHHHIIYAEYLWVMFPVAVLVKGVITVPLIWALFPAQIANRPVPAAHEPMTAPQRRLAVVLACALVLWATDFAHGIRPGWIALGAAVVCLLPRVGVLPQSAFTDVRLGPFFYTGATIGLGGVAVESGLGALLGRVADAAMDLQPGRDFANFIALTLMATLACSMTTNPAQPALLTPIADHFAAAAGWPLNAALMTIATGFTIVLFPYQVPPIVVGMQIAGVSIRTAMRIVVPHAVVGFLLLPLDYLWWRLIGCFG